MHGKTSDLCILEKICDVSEGRCLGFFVFVCMLIACMAVCVLAGLYAMNQGGREISANCYIEQARLAKSVQSVAVILTSVTLACAAVWGYQNYGNTLAKR